MVAASTFQYQVWDKDHQPCISRVNERSTFNEFNWNVQRTTSFNKIQASNSILTGCDENNKKCEKC